MERDILQMEDVAMYAVSIEGDVFGIRGLE
jgi:hypothetical protein